MCENQGYGKSEIAVEMEWKRKKYTSTVNIEITAKRLKGKIVQSASESVI
jgi:hypothetical protein